MIRSSLAPDLLGSGASQRNIIPNNRIIIKMVATVGFPPTYNRFEDDDLNKLGDAAIN